MTGGTGEPKKPFDQESYERELREFWRVLDTVSIVGVRRRHPDLTELERLLTLYPDEAQKLLRHRRDE